MPPPNPSPDRPFKILIFGDFSGRASQSASDFSIHPQRVDRDTLDDVMSRMNVAIDVDGVPLTFQELEDFHPDRILNSIPEWRSPCADPASAAAAQSGGLLDRILANEPQISSRPVTVKDAGDLAGFIRRVSAGSTVPRELPETRRQAAAPQRDTADRLRRILRNPQFQTLEAAWRSLQMLVRSTDNDSEVQVYILDATLPELVQHIKPIHEALRQSESWALLVGNYSFNQGSTHVAVLQRIAALASSLTAPFVAEAEPPGDNVSSDWQEFRNSPTAYWTGLALPRILLRLPYGKSTSEIESFAFEEMPQQEHSAYLWGNPAFFCASLLAQAFIDSGWALSPIPRRIDGLPLHIYHADGETIVKPCAEILMTERNAGELMDLGLIPMATLKEQDAVLAVRLASTAYPPAPLPGFGPRRPDD